MPQRYRFPEHKRLVSSLSVSSAQSVDESGNLRNLRMNLAIRG